MISAGKGKFGLVYLAQHKGSGKYVAIKYITKQAIFDSQRIDKFQQEFNVLQTIRHPFVMECYGGIDVSEYFDTVFNVLTSVSSLAIPTVPQTPSCIGIICEFVPGGELYHRLKKVVRISEAEAKFYFCELALVLRYLHDTLQLVRLLHQIWL